MMTDAINAFSGIPTLAHTRMAIGLNAKMLLVVLLVNDEFVK